MCQSLRWFWKSNRNRCPTRFNSGFEVTIETVNPRNTSGECHACGEIGYRPRQATFTCTNDACWMGEYQADVNGAINIADRYLSGESHSKKHTDGDDSAEDGTFDRPTRHPSRC